MNNPMEEKMKDRYRIAVVTVVLALFAVAMGAAASGVAAQSATVSSEDVTLANQGDTGNSSIIINATEGVAGADIFVSVDTSVGEITEARETQSGSGVGYSGGIDVAPDGSNATINYTDIQGSQSDFEVAELELQSNTPNVDSTLIALSDVTVFNQSGTGEQSVTEDEGTLSTGAQPNFDIDEINLNPDNATSSIQEGQNETYDVTVENTGSAQGTQDVSVTISDNGQQVASASEQITLNQSESTTVTLEPDTSGVSVADSKTFNVSVDTDDDRVEGLLTIFDPDNAENVITGDVADLSERPINTSEVEIDLKYIGGSGDRPNNITLLTNASLQDFADLPDSNQVEADLINQNAVTGGAFIEKFPNNKDEYNVRFAHFGDGSRYLLQADSPGFGAFDGDRNFNSPGTSQTVDIRLERFVNADDIDIDKTPAGGTVDLDGTINDNVTVFTEDDSRGGGIGQPAPLSNTPVNVTIVDSNTNEFGSAVDDSDLVIDPTPPEDTDSNGNVEFDFSLDQSSITAEDINGDVDFTLEFEATDNGGEDRVTQRQDITFQGEPPAGDGTVSGDVEEIVLDGPNNVEDAEGIGVHVVRTDRVNDNTFGFPGTGGPAEDRVWPTPEEDVVFPESAPGEGNNFDEFFRVAELDANGSVTEILDVRTDYLVGSTGAAISQNLTLPNGSDFTGFTADSRFGFVVAPLEPGNYTIQYSNDGSFNFPVTSDFEATNNLTYEFTEQRFEDNPAVPTDITGDDGTYELYNLFTDADDTGSEDYVAIAGDDTARVGFANMRGYDTVEVEQNANPGQLETDLTVFEVGVNADTIVGENLGQVPNAGEADGDFEDALDRSNSNNVTRDGREVDVIEIQTLVEGDRIGAEATVSIDDVSDPSFDGEFLNRAVNASVEDHSPDEITVDTTPEEEGQAVVFLQSDGPLPKDVFVQIEAALENGLDSTLIGGDVDPSDDFNPGKQFVGVTEYDSGSITGDITRDDDALTDTFVWTREIDDVSNNEISILPHVDNIASTPGTISFEDLQSDSQVANLNFTVRFNDSATPQPVDESFITTGSELRSIDLQDRVGPIDAPNVSTFNLLRFANPLTDDNPGQYSMDRVPGQEGTDEGGAEIGVQYELIEARQYDTGERGTTNVLGQQGITPGLSRNADITIPGAVVESEFLLSNLDPEEATVTEGDDPIDISVDVENDGIDSGTQDIVLEVTDENGTVDFDDTKTVQVDAQDNTTVEFTGVPAGTLDPGEYDHIVSSDDDTIEGNLTVEEAEPADFQLSNLDPEEATVTEGDDPIDISVDVDNVGASQGDQDLELTVENSSGVQFSDTISGVQLGAGANTTETFTDVPAGDLAPGEYDHIVSSDDDTVEGNLTVQEAPEFQISNADASPDPVTQGENVTISADVENVGGPGTQDIQFEVNGTATGTGALDIAFLIDRSGSMSDEIDAVANATQDFAATVDQSADARYGVVTYGDPEPNGLRIQQEFTNDVGQLQSTIDGINANALGTELNYDAIDQTVNNDSVLSPRTDARLVLIDLTDEDTDIRTDFSTGEILTPNGTVLKNDMESQDVSFFGVTAATQADLFNGGDLNEPSFEFDGYKKWLAENTSDGQFFDLNAQDLSQQFEDEIAEAVAQQAGGTPLTLNASETDTVEFMVDTSDFAPGEFDFNVTSPDDEESGNFTVEAPPTADFQLSNLDPEEATVTEGDDPINISVDVDNVGGAQGTQDLELTVENSSGVQFSDTATGVQLGAGANTTVEFTNVPAGTLSVGDYDHIVSSDNDTVEGNLTVESGALFQEPLPAFPNGAPPTNTQEVNATLFEDVDGDGDGLETDEAVELWSDLIQDPSDYNSLTQAQVDALDWNGDGQLTPADAVELWSEKIQTSP